MPLKRIPVSVSQLCEQLEIDPKAFRGVEYGQWTPTPGGGQAWQSSMVMVLVEDEMAQPSGTFPQLNQGKKGNGKGGKRGC